MALGHLRYVHNTDPKFGADPWYFFVKVQTPGHAEKNEEYWLVTEEESLRFHERASLNPEDAPDRRRGILVKVANTDPKFGAATEYHTVVVASPGGPNQVWMLTDHDLTRIRERVAKNHEDIEKNRESWLADLLD